MKTEEEIKEIIWSAIGSYEYIRSTSEDLPLVLNYSLGAIQALHNILEEIKKEKTPDLK